MDTQEVYTGHEKRLLGRQVKAVFQLSIPLYTVQAGEVGEIVDFGSQSGDPIVNFSNGRQFICTWGQVVLIN